MTTRPIKFRALRSDGKGMVYGDLIHLVTGDGYKGQAIITNSVLRNDDTIQDDCLIYDKEEVHVILPETLGQYWRTINGVDVYEGDILQCDGILWVLKRDEDGFYIENDSDKTYVYELLKYDIFHEVGSIHTNPEMI